MKEARESYRVPLAVTARRMKLRVVQLRALEHDLLPWTDEIHRKYLEAITE